MQGGMSPLPSKAPISHVEFTSPLTQHLRPSSLGGSEQFFGKPSPGSSGGTEAHTAVGVCRVYCCPPLVEALGFPHGALDVQSSHILPVLLQQGHQEVDGQVDVVDELILCHLHVTDSHSQTEHLGTDTGTASTGKAKVTRAPVQTRS